MSEKLSAFICEFAKQQADTYKRYLLAALESKEGYLCYIDQSLGTPMPSIDVRNCQLLTDAKLFREELKFTRDGRNRYQLFYLTVLGKEMAQQIKDENYTSEMPATA